MSKQIESFCHWYLEGHEDLDQMFSQQAALLSRHEFSTPHDVIDLLDSSCRPEIDAEFHRKAAKKVKVDMVALKLDQVADWKAWVQAIAVRLMGLRL